MDRTLRVLAISDIHGRKSIVKRVFEHEEVDHVFIAGDITNFGSVEEAEDILNTVAELVNGLVLFVPGNCDPQDLLEYKLKESRIVNVHGTSYRIGELCVVGVGGGLVSPFNTWIEFREEEYASLISETSKDITNHNMIVLSHTPPYSTKLDRVRSGVHVGSKSLRKFIEEKNPLLCVCGHIHESRGLDRIGNTIMVNPGPLAWGYYAIIDIGEDVKVSLKSLR